MKHIENNSEYAGLSVNQGVSQPPSINPYLAQKLQHRRREYTAAEYIEEIRKGNITVLSQAVTLVESQLPEHQAIAQEVGEVTFFAYPYGIRESDATAFIEKLFPVTLTTERRVADLTKGIKNLPRIAVRMEVDLGKIL